MTLKRLIDFLNIRSCVLIVMMGLLLAFCSAETRATVMVRMTEEGVSRFYEDKVSHLGAEVVRLRHAQHGRKPTELPIPRGLDPMPPLPAAAFSRPLRAVSPRAPPHQPRAPPAHA